MPYYPKSQVKTSLYTNGGEYVLITTGANYKGYYYLISTGKKYVGKIPTNGPSIEIVPLGTNLNISPQSPSLTPSEDPYGFSRNTQNTNRMSFLDISQDTSITYQVPENISTELNAPLYTPPSQVYLNRQVPTFSPSLPTNQDSANGYFMRYFCKKNNELKYIEINQATYTKLFNQDKDIAWDLYSPAEIKWQLTGDPTQVSNSNLASITYIESTQNWVGFSQYFKNNFLKYYVGV